MKSTWQLLDTEYRSSNNWAWGTALIGARVSGLIPDTFRFFQLSSPSISIGHYQTVEHEVRMEYCRNHGIEINRRLTGGNTVYWDDSLLGWELVLSSKSKSFFAPPDLLTKKLGEACVVGLQQLGINAKYKSPDTIVVDNRQIGWIGGTESNGIFLYQGYIRVSKLNVNTTLRALRVPSEKLKDKEKAQFSNKYTSTNQALDMTIERDTIKAVLLAGFVSIFDVIISPDKLSTYEEILNQNYGSEIFSRKQVKHSFDKQGKQHEFRYILKDTQIIYVSLVIDLNNNRIQSVSISGDFYAYPFNTITKLEACLSGIPANYQSIRHVVRNYFEITGAFLAGSTVDLISQAITGACAKANFTEWGLCPAEANEIETVGKICGDEVTKSLPEDIFTKSIPLLLPYCAKKTTCKFRFTEGCSLCGQCNVGKAYEMAEEYGLKPITIQNYEMLEEKLKELKMQGCSMFIGTCCENFWVKHRDDFDRIGLPGILVNIDNSTCYDLGKEQSAHEGTFENQTQLKNDLLRRIISRFIDYRGNTQKSI